MKTQCPFVHSSILSTNIYWILWCCPCDLSSPLWLISVWHHHAFKHPDIKYLVNSDSLFSPVPPCIHLEIYVHSFSLSILSYLHYCSFSNFISSCLGCCEIFQGFPASTHFLCNLLCLLFPVLPTTFHYNQHFLKFVQCRTLCLDSQGVHIVRETHRWITAMWLWTAAVEGLSGYYFFCIKLPSHLVPSFMFLALVHHMLLQITFLLLCSHLEGREVTNSTHLYQAAPFFFSEKS